MNWNVLIADEMHPSLFEMLDKIGIQYSYQPTIKRDEIKTELSHYEGLIIRSKTVVDKDLLDFGNNLKFIARAGAGLDLIDLEETKNRKIELFAANEGNRDAVAEHTLAMILCLFNKINLANAEVKNGIWHREANRGLELMGKTWGIIGFGNNGQATAQRLSGFGVEVLAFDKFDKNIGNNFAKKATMNEIFEKADILSIHVPLTELTNKMVNSDFLKKFKKKIFLINIARGEIVVLKDLLEALHSGKVLGACLDVFENEKIKDLNQEEKQIFDSLAALPNTIFTPHIAGWTQESYVKINEVLVEKIKSFLKI
ncbi:MAG: NAD(P)-dependent oxidoreductase [Bacteroidota bacterium]